MTDLAKRCIEDSSTFEGDQLIFGRCYVKDEHLPIWIPIEKNVSKVIQSMVVSCGYQESTVRALEKHNAPAMVILQDPIKRWVSGLVEYLLLVDINRTRNTDNNMTRLSVTPEVVFDQIIFDVHTFPQSSFIKGLDLNCDFIWFDAKKKSQLVPTVSKYFTEKGVANNHWSIGPYDQKIDDQKHRLTKLYAKMLKENPALLEKVKNVYAEDYKLINSIEFYT